MTANEEVLNSWKEIAAYLGRGVRTVQRWEQELGLPVRRPRGKSRSAVIAFKPELDKWLHHAPAEQLKQDEQQQAPRQGAGRVAGILSGAHPKFKQCHAELHRNTQLLLARTMLIVSRSTELCEQLSGLRTKLEQTVQLSSNGMERKPQPCPLPVAKSSQKEQRPALAGPASSHHAVAS
jgi:hypothetical protein